MPRRPRTRPALFPLPVAELFANPSWIALPVAGRGMLITICEHFWRTACAPLPRDDDQLFAIARAHRPTWRHHKAAILAIFAEIQPGLEAYHRQRLAGWIGFRRAGDIGGQANAARIALASLDISPPSPSGSALSRPAPVSLNPPKASPKPQAAAPGPKMTDRMRAR